MSDLNDDYFLSGFTVIMYIPREHRLLQVRIIKGASQPVLEKILLVK